MKYPIQVSYTFTVFSGSQNEGESICRGALSVHFEGDYEMDPEPVLGSKVAIVPTLLRNDCGRGCLSVVEILSLPTPKVPRHSTGYTRKGFKLAPMREYSTANESCGVALCKDLAKQRIADHIIPYMRDIVGLNVIGKVPYYKEW